MSFVIGFVAMLLPSIVFIVIRNRQLAISNAEGIRQKREDWQRHRQAARDYRKWCRANNQPIPMSTDDFYDGFDTTSGGYQG